ncbi:S53 family peptidase [Ferroacidibacillus organovorans]|uniref:S53 family peptidase n=1 Tax=Ferroacidibacillus organovorans TaxID=1765683 RepID=UPI0015C46798|nr:protease pro-enzyme activation domain-containing protein [Ferroacidibacillus organovorans]
MTITRKLRTLTATSALLASTIWPLAGLTAAHADTQDVNVPQGVGDAVLNNATVFGTTPANTPVTVTIALNTVNTQALQSYIQQTTTPGSSNYHQFLSVEQFANQFGQPEVVIQAITNYLSQYGISTTVFANHLAITANGTAGQFNQAFSVQLQNMIFGGKKFHGTKEAPKMPGNLAQPILAVLGLTNYGNFASHAVKPLPQLVRAKSTSSTSVPPGELTPAFVASHYNVNPLYKANDYGQGQTIGIVTLASVNPSDVYSFWNTLGLTTSPNRINLVNVDGGAGPVSLQTGSDETTLDVEQSGALAPQANIIVYQAPNTDYGFADAFFQAVSDNQAGSISTSWGESEPAIQATIASGQESPNYNQVFNEIAMEAAAQGISMFAAAGDAGAYDASRDVGTTQRSVDAPADSPYITAAGGTTIAGTQNYGSFSVTVPQERAWGWDYLWPYWQQFGASSETSFAEALVAGGGGGYSSMYAAPWYQSSFNNSSTAMHQEQHASGLSQFSAVPYLKPISGNTAWLFNPTPSVITSSSPGRAMPDLAMNADPQTGYAVYSTLFTSAYGSPWAQYGGTSFVAPQLAGVAALINQSQGGRVGFWNPQIYQFAQTSNSPFTPLDTSGTSNDNLYYTGQQGALFNPGTGLGIPDFAKLAASFTSAQNASGN